MGSVQVKKAQGRDGQHVLKRSEGMWKKGVEEGEWVFCSFSKMSLEPSTWDTFLQNQNV